MNKSFLFIGGDERQLYAAENLSNCGHKVSLYGFGKKDNFSYSDNFDFFVLPAPFTKDKENVFAPLCEKNIPFSDLEGFCCPSLLIGGGFENFSFPCEKFDLLKHEEYNILNAVASAEGAISLAIKHTPFNLKGSTVLVCGYGKIGKCLSSALSGMGAKVFVAARKETDRAYVKANGFTPLDYPELYLCADKFDIIFNTVPSLIIKEEIIKVLKKHCLLLDLASMPGGIDFDAADRYGIKHLHALSLPGKYSPKTSGKIISDIILKITGGSM